MYLFWFQKVFRKHCSRSSINTLIRFRLIDLRIHDIYCLANFYFLQCVRLFKHNFFYRKQLIFLRRKYGFPLSIPTL